MLLGDSVSAARTGFNRWGVHTYDSGTNNSQFKKCWRTRRGTSPVQRQVNWWSIFESLYFPATELIRNH